MWYYAYCVIMSESMNNKEVLLYFKIVATQKIM